LPGRPPAGSGGSGASENRAAGSAETGWNALGSRPPVAPQKKKKPFGPGSTVRHPKYGRGMVLRREGEGDEAKLTVNFPGFGLEEVNAKIRRNHRRRMNTKHITDRTERKQAKRTARKKAAPKPKRAEAWRAVPRSAK
jgi:hypothetical protein